MKSRKSNNKIAKKSNPKLWESIKKKVIAGTKGGESGKSSARKMQMAVAEYKRRGGKYIGKKSRKNSLTKWSREKWDYISPKSRKLKRGRYLPEVIRKSLTSREKRIENRRKGSRRGKWIPYSRSVAKKFKKYKII